MPGFSSATDDDLIRQLRALGKRKPLSKQDHEAAQEIMIGLKGRGYSNEQVSEFSDGGWSVFSVKNYVKGVTPGDTSSKLDVTAAIIELAKQEIPFQQVIDVAHTTEDLEAMGLAVEDVSLFVAEAAKSKLPLEQLGGVLKEAVGSGLSVAELKSALGLKDLLDASGLGYDKAKLLADTVKTYGTVDEILTAINQHGSLRAIEARITEVDGQKGELEEQARGLGKEVEDATNNLTSLEDQEKAKQKEIGNLVREYKVSLAAAKSYVATRHSLESIGFDIDDLASTEKCLKILKQKKYNPAHLIATFSQIEDLAAKIASAKGELTGLKEDVERKDKELKHVVEELRKRKDDLQEAKMLGAAGLSVEAIRQIRETVELAGKRRKVAPSEALRNFREDIEKNYDVVLGLKQTIRELGTAKQSADRELGEKETMKGGLDRYCEARQKQIAAYERLTEKGIDDKTLLMWDDALSESGLDKATVAAELKSYASLDKSRERLRQEISKDEDRKKTLSSDVGTLESSKAGIVASIKTITEEGVRLLESHLDKFKGSVGQIEKQTLDSVTSTSKEVKENVKGLEDSVTETVAKVKGELDTMGARVDNLLGKTVQLGKDTQRFSQAAPLLEFYDNGTGTRTVVFSGAITFVGKLLGWAKENNLFGLQMSAQTLLGDLLRESNFGKV